MGLWKNSFPGAGNLARRLRSLIAEMGLWWGLAHTRFGKRLTSGVVCSHRQASSLRGERDLDNLTQDRLRIVLTKRALAVELFLFLSCFSRRAIGLHYSLFNSGLLSR